MDIATGLTAVLLIFSILITGNCVPSYVSCPQTDPLDRTVFYPHENNCTEFYRCDHGSALLQYCPGGLHWNPTLDTCDWPWNAGCSPGSGSGGSGGGCEGSGGVGTGSCPAGKTPTCPYPDPAYSVFYPHENDCHWFYHCSNGVAYCKVCPAGLHWNTDLDTCDWPWHAGCTGGTGGSVKPPVSGSCPVPQPAFNIYFPDLSDCSNFYQCSHGVAYQQKCPAGLHFNSRLNVCDYPEKAGCLDGNSGDTEQEVPAAECPECVPPLCPISNADLSVYFPHPVDEHWFYHCSHGVASCKICPSGLRWNQAIERCDW